MEPSCNNSTEAPLLADAPLVGPHPSWLRKLVESRVGDTNTADDVLQEVHTAAFASKNGPPGPDLLRPWLCRIALRQCWLALRKRHRQQRLVQQAASASVPSVGETDDPIYALIAQEERSQVVAAMRHLDDESQRLLTWKYVDHLTYDLLAERLKISRDAAEYRVLRARRALRGALAEVGYEESMKK